MVHMIIDTDVMLEQFWFNPERDGELDVSMCGQ